MIYFALYCDILFCFRKKRNKKRLLYFAHIYFVSQFFVPIEYANQTNGTTLLGIWLSCFQIILMYLTLKILCHSVYLMNIIFNKGVVRTNLEMYDILSRTRYIYIHGNNISEAYIKWNKISLLLCISHGYWKTWEENYIEIIIKSSG
jgi:hypothetical protein